MRAMAQGLRRPSRAAALVRHVSEACQRARGRFIGWLAEHVEYSEDDRQCANCYDTVADAAAHLCSESLPEHRYILEGFCAGACQRIRVVTAGGRCESCESLSIVQESVRPRLIGR